ncbi:phage integrase family protein [Cupriavidus necator]
MAEDRDTLAATKLTRTEFAVVRAYAQGMRPVDIANRYLADPDDDDTLTEHQAIQRILQLRDRLVQFALQHDRPDIAEMFEALRGRSDVGMTRRIDALSSIEQLGQGRPLASHQVSLWFGPHLARRLVAANLLHISDLTALANQRGSSWWRVVPRIGRKSAETITRWLVSQRLANNPIAVASHVVPPSQAGHHEPLAPHYLSPSLPYPVPLEKMLAPQGSPTLAEDLAFVRHWLEHRRGSPNTWLSYRRETERLLLWRARQGKAVRSLGDDDMAAYQAFLAAPEPSAFWCGPAGPRESTRWRPLERALAPASIKAACRVVRALLRAMQTAGLRTASLPATPTRSQAPAAPRPVADTVAFVAWMQTCPPSPRQRAALATALLMQCHGVRLAHIAELRLAHVSLAGIHAQLDLGPRHGTVNLEQAVSDALRAHLADRNLRWQQPRAPEAALLAPQGFPHTSRGRAKQAQDGAGYSASGLDQLLRAMWRLFAIQAGERVGTFTPASLRRK